jgi:hypothetical protein
MQYTNKQSVRFEFFVRSTLKILLAQSDLRRSVSFELRYGNLLPINDMFDVVH